jgi:hypothetical protein
MGRTLRHSAAASVTRPRQHRLQLFLDHRFEKAADLTAQDRFNGIKPALAAFVWAKSEYGTVAAELGLRVFFLALAVARLPLPFRRRH